MLKLVILIHTTLLSLEHRAQQHGAREHVARRSDRGSVTTEHVLWAVAVIAIAGIVVAAIKGYVTTQAGNIK